VTLSATVADSDGTVTSIVWVVLDQQIGQGQSALIQLPDGDTLVTVRVTDDKGATAEDSITVSVLPPASVVERPVVSIAGGDRVIADSDSLAGEFSVFSAQIISSNEIVDVLWSIGGQTVGSGIDAEIFLPDGLSQLQVLVTDSAGQTGSASAAIQVLVFVAPPSEAEVNAVVENLQASTSLLSADLDQLIGNGGNGIDTETLQKVSALSELAASSAQSLLQGINAGTVSTGSAINALSSAGASAQLTVRVVGVNGTAESQTQLVTEASNVVRGTAAALDSLASRNVSESGALNTDEQQQVKQLSNDLLDSAGDLAGVVTTAAQLSDLAQSANQIIQANTRLGIAADEQVVAKVREVSTQIGTVAVQQALQSLGSDLNVSDDEIRQILSQNDDLLETVFQATLNLPPSVVASTSETQQALDDAASSQDIELDEDAAQRLAENTNQTVIRPDNIIVDGMSVLDIIRALFQAPTTATLLDDNGRVLSVIALQANDADIEVDRATGAVTVRLPGEIYSGVIISVKSVPATVPAGIRFRADGRGVIVNNGVAIEIAPAPVNLLRFAATVEAAGFRFSIRNNAAISLDLGNQQRFSGVFAYDNLAGFETSNCGALSIIEPPGPEYAAEYSYGIRCANGIVQRVQPYVEAVDFVDSIRAAGFAVRIDRSSGIVNIVGEARFKPSFIVVPMTSQERLYHAANKDRFGLAYRAQQRPDGRIDYVVLSPAGAQMLYAVD